MTRLFGWTSLLVLVVTVALWWATDGASNPERKNNYSMQLENQAPHSLREPTSRTEPIDNEIKYPYELRKQLVNYNGYWDHSLRSQLLRLPPSDILDFFDNDDILAREDARDLIVDIRDWCILALMSADQGFEKSRESPPRDKWLLGKIQDSTNSGWCSSLANEPDAYNRMQKLVDLIHQTNASDVDHYSSSDKYVRSISDNQELKELLLSDRADLVVIALHELQSRGDTSVIQDWSPLNKFRPEELRDILQYLRTGLECQQYGNCSAHGSPSVSALCLNIKLHCDIGWDFHSIMRRNLSPAQLDALTMLMNGVTIYRHQYDG